MPLLCMVALAKGDVGDLAVLDADHHVALFVEERLDGCFAHPRGEDAVYGRR